MIYFGREKKLHLITEAYRMVHVEGSHLEDYWLYLTIDYRWILQFYVLFNSISIISGQ